MNKIKIHVFNTEVLQRGVDSFLDAMVPTVMQLGCDPNLFTGHARVPNALAHLLLIFVRECPALRDCCHYRVGNTQLNRSEYSRINMPIAS